MFGITSQWQACKKRQSGAASRSGKWNTSGSARQRTIAAQSRNAYKGCSMTRPWCALRAFWAPGGILPDGTVASRQLDPLAPPPAPPAPRTGPPSSGRHVNPPRLPSGGGWGGNAEANAIFGVVAVDEQGEASRSPMALTSSTSFHHLPRASIRSNPGLRGSKSHH
jgi:hypothetical protein